MGRVGDAEKIVRELIAHAGVEPDGSNPWDPQIRDNRIWDRVLRDRELGLGESYQDGWFEVDQLDEMITRIQTARIQDKITSSPRLMAAAAGQLLLNRQSRRKAAENASAHYDIGNDLYERMLDKRMIYSCAWWQHAQSLDAAQEAKLDLICRKLGVEPGMRLLDIGCGWGGLAHFAATRHGVEVTGISPAIEQVRLARERCDGTTATILQRDYREMSGTFDRIVSVGMMEHVGTKNLSRFFDVCDDLLADDGMMLHHTIGSNRSSNKADPWFDRYIFPGGVLPSVAQVAKAAEPNWTIEDVHNFGPDYDRTLMAWSANVETAWADLPHYDERFRRTWHYYLMASAGAFRSRSIQLWQFVFRRSHQRSDVYQGVR